jgi:hypothetical protein
VVLRVSVLIPLLVVVLAKKLQACALVATRSNVAPVTNATPPGALVLANIPAYALVIGSLVIALVLQTSSVVSVGHLAMTTTVAMTITELILAVVTPVWTFPNLFHLPQLVV